MKFLKRPDIQQTDVYRRRVWRAVGHVAHNHAKLYRVSEFIRLLEDGSRVFKAEVEEPVMDANGESYAVWDVISHHRTRGAAMRACVTHANSRKLSGERREALEV